MARPPGMKQNPKYVLVALGRKADYPYAIVDWRDKEVFTYLTDRNEGLDQVRELNGNPLTPVRKRARRHGVRADLLEAK